MGELGGKHLPHFPINRGRSEEEFRSALQVIQESLEISEKNWFREENPSREASVRFCNVSVGIFREDFQPFFDVLRSFFIVLRSSTGKFPNRAFQFILCTRGGPHLFF